MEQDERRVIELKHAGKFVPGGTARYACHAGWLGVIALATVVGVILAQRFGWF